MYAVWGFCCKRFNLRSNSQTCDVLMQWTYFSSSDKRWFMMCNRLNATSETTWCYTPTEPAARSTAKTHPGYSSVIWARHLQADRSELWIAPWVKIKLVVFDIVHLQTQASGVQAYGIAVQPSVLFFNSSEAKGSFMILDNQMFYQDLRGQTSSINTIWIDFAYIQRVRNFKNRNERIRKRGS